MYTPRHFAADEAAGLDLIERNGFGTLIMQGADGSPEISHFPFVLDRDGNRLLAHAARANPIWKLMDGSAQATAVFEGPKNHLALVWLTTWDSEDDAREFATAYAHYQTSRFDDIGKPPKNIHDTLWRNVGDRLYVVERRGMDVAVIEGFAPETTVAMLEAAFRGKKTELKPSAPPKPAEKPNDGKAATANRAGTD